MDRKINITFLLLLSFFSAKAQLPPLEGVTLDDLLNSGTAQKVQKTTTSSGVFFSVAPPQQATLRTALAQKIILDRSADFADLRNFYREEFITNHDYFEQALTDLYIASNKNQFENHEVLRSKVLELRDHYDEVFVGILNASYQTVNYNIEDNEDPNNGFVYVDESLVPVEGQEQFIDYHTTVISPLKKRVKGNVITFRFAPHLFYNVGKEIAHIEVDFGNGSTQTIYEDGDFSQETFSVSDLPSGEVFQHYTVAYTDSTQVSFKSQLDVLKNDAFASSAKIVSTRTRDGWHQSQYPFQGYEETSPDYAEIEYRIFFADDNLTQKLHKPIFILDGFDPEDDRRIHRDDYISFGLDPDKDTPIYEKMNYKNSQGKEDNLVKTLQAKGYDVIICNFPTHRKGLAEGRPKVIKTIFGNLSPFCIDLFPCYELEPHTKGGADYVERNALGLVSFIQETNEKLQTNGSTEKLVVMGSSMGGVISRYALAYMEKKQAETGNEIWNHNTKIWVSMDAPHLGANIPIGIQAAVYLAKNDSPGASDSYNNQLKSITAQQFLINQHKSGSTYHHLNYSYMNGKVNEQGFEGWGESGSSFYQQFYKNLYNNGLPGSKGFPQQVERSLAIVNGDITGQSINYDGEETLYIRGYNRMCVILGLVCTDVHVATLGVRNLPSQGNTAQISKFYKAFIGTKTTKGRNESHRGNPDTWAGGYNDTFDVLANETKDSAEKRQWFHIVNTSFFGTKVNNYSVATNKHTHSFIPSVSALALNNPKRNWGESLVKDIWEDEGNLTPFDNYITPNNNESHIMLSKANVNWLLAELDENPIDGKQFKFIYNRTFKSNTQSRYLFGNILVAGKDNDVNVEPNATVHLVAKNKIVFNKGFKAEIGANFKAEINEDSEDTFVSVADHPKQELLTFSEDEETVLISNFKKDLSLGEDVETTSGLFYPNPNQGIFTLQNIYNLQKIEIYNFDGQIVYQQFVFIDRQVDVSFLPTGMYILKLTKNGLEKTVNIVIKH